MNNSTISTNTESALAALWDQTPRHVQQEAATFWLTFRHTSASGSSSASASSQLTPGEQTVICMYRLLSPAAKRLISRTLDIVEGRSDAPTIAS